MDKQPVGQLPDLTQSNNDDEIMVITNSEYNQLKKEKISDFITDLTSTDENNAIVKGTDGKLFTKNFGNAANITEGTLPVSVLPDIPKNKLPEIEIDDLPDSGITAGTYTYPTDIVINSKGQVTSITEGQAGANNANQDLSNLGPLGLDKLNQSKALETGSVSSDADVFADILSYKNSSVETGIDTIKPDDYTVVGTPTITDDGIASGFNTSNYLYKDIDIDLTKEVKMIIQYVVGDITSSQYFCSYGDGWDNGLHFEIQGSTGFARANMGDIACQSSIKYTKGDVAKFILTSNNNGLNYSCDFYKNGTFEQTVKSPALSGALEPPVKKLLFGILTTTTPSYSTGSIDLNTIQVWVDGALVCQPCLKIPYTLSKTGSKIVDAAYRDRVQDVYEQYGVAMYYTLDEENQNFTLPMGEIYGMIEKKDGGSGFEVGDIGINALGIDESKGLRRYLNGTLLTVNVNTQAFVNKLKSAAALYPSLVCTETEWQSIATTSVGGQCGKFVINYDTDGTTVESVRLPKIIMPIQGLTDLSKLGEIVEAGLPNIEGSISSSSSSWLKISQDTTQATGALKFSNQANEAAQTGTTNGFMTLEFDASNSNDHYGNSETVQQEQIQYPYFIQIATGQETEVNITNEIELNNPYTLFDSKYSEAPLYNASWLLSNGTYYSKSVYVTAYEALVVENNTEIDAGTSVQLPSGTTYIKRGLSVKLSTTEDITDYDFVINTTNETFRLPVKVKLAGSKMVVGNGIVLGVTDGTSNYGIKNVIGSSSGWVVRQDMYGAAVGTGNTGRVFPPDNVGLGITTDPTKSGLELCDSNLYLYYYIGETVQNANLIDAGKFAEQLSDINAPSRGYLVESYINGTSWYRVYSDGWCEQGGYNSNTGTYTVTMMKEFADTNYTLLTQYAETTNATNQVTPNELSTWNKTTSSFTTYSDFAGKIWLAFGYVA